MLKIYQGDLLDHLHDDDKIKMLPHIVNNNNAFYSGYVAALNKKWPYELKDKSPQWLYFNCPEYQELGKTLIMSPEHNIMVANMCAQDNKTPNLQRRVHYGYLAHCMRDIVDIRDNYAIMIPWIGCGIGGGDKQIITELIDGIWSDIDVRLYEI